MFIIPRTNFVVAWGLGFKNTVVDAVLEQCPELRTELRNPRAKELSGEEILNILCEQNCTRLRNSNTPSYGRNDIL